MYKKNYEKIKSVILKYRHGTFIINLLNKIITSLVYLIYPSLLALLFFNKDKRIWPTLFIPGLGFLIISIYRSYTNYPRPYELYDIIPIINKDTKGKSFPSRHVFSIFIIAKTLYYISNLLGAFLMVLGSILAVLRVLGGVHFPKDVIVGAISGLLFGIIGHSIYLYF